MSYALANSQIPADVALSGQRANLVRVATVSASNIEPREWASIIGVLMCVHSGSDTAAVDLETAGGEHPLTVTLDMSERPRRQPQEPRFDHSISSSACVTDNHALAGDAHVLVVQLHGGMAVLWLDSNSFSRPVRERLAVHVQLLASKDVAVAAIELPVVTSPRSSAAVPGASHARAEPEWGACIIRRLLDVVRAFPDTVALASEGLSLTYRELAARVGGLAEEIRRTAPAGAQLAIMAEHGIEPVVGMLACLAAGMSYIPLDPRMPDGRLRRILDRCQPEAVMYGVDLAERARVLSPTRRLMALTSRVADLVPPPSSAVAEPAAYVLFTSGSTGNPKGVAQSVPAIMQHARNYRDSIGLVAGEVVPLLAAFSFDAAVMDLYGGLLSGATLHVVDPMQPADSLRELLEERPPDVLHGTPTLLRHVLDGVNQPWTALAKVRAVVFGGERVLTADVERVRLALPAAYVINGLGPSECTVGVQHVIVPDEPLDDRDIPIGSAAPGVTVELVDSHGRPAQITGELVFTSAAVASGYQNEPELSARRFTARNDRRAFRTGDRAWIRPDGSLIFLGRTDRQIKVRGQQVDPNEIESVLMEHRDVDQAWVGIDADNHWTAYLTSNSAATPDGEEIRRFARRSLPAIAVPTRIVVVSELPIGYTGKIDLNALGDLTAVAESGVLAAVPTPDGPLDDPVTAPDRAPMTFGQLSVVRSLRGKIRTEPANVSRVVDLPISATLDRVEQAVRQLVVRHASLRTTFELTESSGLRQMIAAEGTVPLRAVELPEDTPPARRAVAATLEAETYDIEREPGWRAAVITSGGAAVAVALSLHHILADAWALSILERELIGLVSEPDRDLGRTSMTPADLARRQRGDGWQSHRAMFNDHWEPIFDDPRRFPSAGLTEAGPRTVIGMTLDLGRAELAHIARRWSVFPSTVLTSLAMVSWPSISSRAEPSLLSATIMSAGRVDEDLQHLVASQNQVVPISVDRLDAEPFAKMACRVQESLFGAIMAGVYDVDAVCARAGVEEMGHLLDHWVNVLEENGAEADAAEAPRHMHHHEKFTIVHASHKPWPYFYYRIRIAQRLRVELVVPPSSNSVGALRQVLHGWDAALDILRRDDSSTVDEIIQCFAHTHEGEL
ncbi:AMP-binding protein [Rathayibacter iranicus]|uniref:Amino acid adenylation domain-containing protein n=1 Tax=Rathayibacter iranicus NCPPB 2253 = VKM Ac-1602 TaxID=1328868 RepID=A0ABX5L914_9MICO|nr:AMP-binding protein [Rathayibacter iranicus]PWJ61540.1 amino acid adenylation domain-containing protein [Rathayibacter iranicus NCPPB 2253 = VKM Ac-1602]